MGFVFSVKRVGESWDEESWDGKGLNWDGRVRREYMYGFFCSQKFSGVKS